MCRLIFLLHPAHSSAALPLPLAYQKTKKKMQTATMTAAPAIFTMGAVSNEISARSGNRFGSANGSANGSASIAALTITKVNSTRTRK